MVAMWTGSLMGCSYHVRTGITIERLADNYTATSGESVNIPNTGVEVWSRLVPHGGLVVSYAA
jgi:hypothetical protein